MSQSLRILIVDDEPSQRAGLAGMVTAWGMVADSASDGAEALEKLEQNAPDVILTDLNMPGMDGFELLERLRNIGDSPPAIVLTAYGSMDSAVKTVHELGAFWFLEKPIQASALEALVRRAASHGRLRSDNRSLETQLRYKGALGELVGVSPKMQEIFALLQQAGPSKACVLVTGESGTGKEMVARALHRLSPRRQGPFHAINCAALPEVSSKVSSSGMRRDPLRERPSARRAASSCRRTARFCSMKSARCRRRLKPSSCASSKIPRYAGSAAKLNLRWTFAWWRQPTGRLKNR
jgi:Response regulator containing CheY-like receiver, AAA-type ATPase, and DNA-binding domains